MLIAIAYAARLPYQRTVADSLRQADRQIEDVGFYSFLLYRTVQDQYEHLFPGFSLTCRLVEYNAIGNFY